MDLLEILIFVLDFFADWRFGISILLSIIAACVVASMIPNEPLVAGCIVIAGIGVGLAWEWSDA